MRGWEPTELAYDGGQVFVNRVTGELAYELLQERRLFALPAQVDADIRSKLDDGALKDAA